MPIANIDEQVNPVQCTQETMQENQEIYIPDITNPNVPNRNGFITVMAGSGGSGKSNLLLNMVTNKNIYRNRFNNIFYITPESSFCSAVNHPFKDHDKVFHELNVELLEEIYQSLVSIVVEREELKNELKNKNKKKKHTFIDDVETKEKLEKIKPVQYNLIIIDDFANDLKDKNIQAQLSKMLIKARHICCSFIFTVQAFNYFPKILRKQLTNAIIFKCKNVEEFLSLSGELCNMNKNDALTLFNYVFDEPYTHLDIDTWTNTYYKNFNKLNIEYEK